MIPDRRAGGAMRRDTARGAVGRCARAWAEVRLVFGRTS